MASCMVSTLSQVFRNGLQLEMACPKRKVLGLWWIRLLTGHLGWKESHGSSVPTYSKYAHVLEAWPIFILLELQDRGDHFQASTISQETQKNLSEDIRSQKSLVNHWWIVFFFGQKDVAIAPSTPIPAAPLGEDRHPFFSPRDTPVTHRNTDRAAARSGCPPSGDLPSLTLACCFYFLVSWD